MNYKISQGEEKIISILKKEKIKMIREKTFQDLKHGNFRFDFYLPERNILIEYDGQQHFQQVPFFQKTRADFQKTQEYDRRKNSYALAKNISLYRIPFWEFDNIFTLSDILQNKFLVKNKWHNDEIWRKYQH